MRSTQEWSVLLLYKSIYKSLTIQPYLTSIHINDEEAKLLYNLRSRCHPSKLNFRKLYRNDLKCTFGCSEAEDQVHIFTTCQPILSRLQPIKQTNFHQIYGNLSDQKEVIKVYLEIDKMRKSMRDDLLPGEETSRQDPCTQD